LTGNRFVTEATHAVRLSTAAVNEVLSALVGLTRALLPLHSASDPNTTASQLHVAIVQSIR